MMALEWSTGFAGSESVLKKRQGFLKAFNFIVGFDIPFFQHLDALQQILQHLVLEHLNLNLSVLSGGRDRRNRWLRSIQDSPVGLQIELGQTFKHLGILLALLPAELFEGLEGVWREIGVEGTRPCWCHRPIASTLNPTEQEM